MAKVINIVTKQAETELPFNEEDAKEVMNYLMKYKSNTRASLSNCELNIMNSLIKLVENNSGVDCLEALQETAVPLENV